MCSIETNKRKLPNISNHIHTYTQNRNSREEKNIEIKEVMVFVSKGKRRCEEEEEKN